MLPAATEPHDGLGINGLGADVVLWPVPLLYRRRVLLDFSVHVRVGVCLARGSRVPGDVAGHPGLVGHSPRREHRDILVRVRSLLRERRQVVSNQAYVKRETK